MNIKQIDYRVWIALAVLAFFLVISLYAAEIAYFSRYFSFPILMGAGLIFGLILGGAAAWYFGKRIEDSYDRMRFRIGLLFAGLFFGPLLFSLANRQLDPWPAYFEQVEYVDLEERYSSRFGLPAPDDILEPNATHLYFYRNADLIRIIFRKRLNLGELQRGDPIGITVHRGLFGLEWVKSVRAEDGGLDLSVLRSAAEFQVSSHLIQ